MGEATQIVSKTFFEKRFIFFEMLYIYVVLMMEDDVAEKRMKTR